MFEGRGRRGVSDRIHRALVTGYGSAGPQNNHMELRTGAVVVVVGTVSESGVRRGAMKRREPRE